MKNKYDFILIIGPTGSGKTKLSIDLALSLTNAQIINADSVQIYQELNIGSAKVTNEEQKNIKHHLIDIRKPNQSYSIYEYQKDAREIINNLKKENIIPIIVGGSGLYIDALIKDYQIIEFNKKEYLKIKNQIDKLSFEELINELNNFKAKTSDEILKNKQRLVHHLILLKLGKSISYNDKRLFNPLIIGLNPNRKQLYQALNDRVDKQIENNLFEEVTLLYNKYGKTKALNSITYRQIIDYLENKTSKEDAILKIKQANRNYAKRQFTWFKNKVDNIFWFDYEINNFNLVSNEIIKIIKNDFKLSL